MKDDSEHKRAKPRSKAPAPAAPALPAWPESWRPPEPMLCSSREVSLSDPAFVYELKLDGVRVLAKRRDGRVRLYFRSGRDATKPFPDVAQALEAMGEGDFIIDGEIVAFDERGVPDFERVAKRIHVASALDVERAASGTPVALLAFDLLEQHGRDVRSQPLLQRKRALQALLQHGARPTLQFVEHFPGDGRALLAWCEANGAEGIVAKRADSLYRCGTRSDDWVKVKCEREDDFVIIGWVEGENAREVSALELGYYDGRELVTCGRVGSGFDQNTRESLQALLAPLEIAKCPARGALEKPRRQRHFCQPQHIALVRYLGTSEAGRLRFPVYRGLRADKRPEECGAPSNSKATHAPARSLAQLTNPDKIFFPQSGRTKRDVYEYHRAIAPIMLDYLRDRPTVVVRHPDGVRGKNFYQWNLPRHAPPGLRSLNVGDADKKRVIVIDDLETLLFVVNMGVLAIHIMPVRASSLQFADFVVIDLDPNGVDWPQVIELAQTIRSLGDSIGLQSRVKLSGQGGVHIWFPMGPGFPEPAARQLAQLLADITVRERPDLATTFRGPREQRGRKVLVDAVQNGGSRTIAAPYCVRAVEEAAVSMPITWDELEHTTSARDYDITRALVEVERRGDAWTGFFDIAPDIAMTMVKLQAKVG